LLSRTYRTLFVTKSPCKTRVHGHGIADLLACTMWLWFTSTFGSRVIAQLSLMELTSAQPSSWHYLSSCQHGRARDRNGAAPRRRRNWSTPRRSCPTPSAARNVSCCYFSKKKDSCCYVRRYPSMLGINNPCRRKVFCSSQTCTGHGHNIAGLYVQDRLVSSTFSSRPCHCRTRGACISHI